MFAAVGTGVLSAENVAGRIVEQVRPKEEEERPREQSPALAPLPLPEGGTDEQTGVRVVGSSGILTRLARCCTPMPGDEIVGYVSLGRGVVVHSAGCVNARALQARDPERFVEVEWAKGSDKLFTVELLVEALDRMHLLKDITATISDAGVNIVSAQGRHHRGQDGPEQVRVQGRERAARRGGNTQDPEHPRRLRRLQGLPRRHTPGALGGSPVSEIEQVTLSMDGFEVNSYVVHAPEGDIVVDAGAEPEKILGATRAPVAAILVTHGHADHVDALELGAQGDRRPCLHAPRGRRGEGQGLRAPRRRAGARCRRARHQGSSYAGTLPRLRDVRGWARPDRR